MPIAAKPKPALLAIVPPYTTLEPPAGPAYLLAYARARGCDQLGFLDLRLGVPGAYAPTYYHTGLFGECYVMDVPDLPLVLRLLKNFDDGVGLLADLPLSTERYCRERGISVAYVEQYLSCIDKYLREVAARLTGVRFLGFSTWTSNYLTTLMLAAHLKRLPDPPVIMLGGPQVTESRSAAALALRSRLVDVIAVGEGEGSLVDVYADFLAHGQRGHDPLAGTAVLVGDEVVYGPKRPLLPTHEIPIPAFDQMALLSYQDVGHRAVPFHLSRGCTDRCVFCSEWKFWERFRPGDAMDTVEGVKRLQKDYGAEYIAFTDSLLNGHPARLRQFAESVVRDRIEVQWSGFMRANMDAETARLLKRAGCESVFIGIESMSNDTLAAMKKRRTEEHNAGALQAFLQAGIHVVAGLIPGFPKDDRESFMHTSERLRALQRAYPGQLRMNVEPFVVSPGQPLFASLQDFNLQGVAWEEEVLDIAPRYRDVTQGILCRVEGANQGIERVGRMRIAESMESDAGARVDTFDYKGDEAPTMAAFAFEHLRSGWFLARIKSPSAWIYAVILSQEEKDDLEAEMPDDPWGSDAAAKALHKRLGAIAKLHLVKPRQVPRLPEGGYSRRASPSRTYVLSPYVIARASDDGLGHRIFVADFVDQSWQFVGRQDGKIVQALSQRPHTVASVHRLLAGRVSLKRCERILHDLAEAGLVLVRDSMPAEARTPAGPQPAGIAEGAAGAVVMAEAAAQAQVQAQVIPIHLEPRQA